MKNLNNQLLGKDKYIEVVQDNRSYLIEDFTDLNGCFVFATKDKTYALTDVISSDYYSFQTYQGNNYIVFAEGFPINDFKTFKIIKPSEIISIPFTFNKVSSITPDALNKNFSALKDLCLVIQETMNNRVMRLDTTDGQVMLPELEPQQLWVKDTKNTYKAISLSDFKELAETLLSDYVELIKNMLNVLYENARDNIIMTKNNAIKELQVFLENVLSEVELYTSSKKKELDSYTQDKKHELDLYVSGIKPIQYGTIAELQATKNLKIGDVVELNGYYSAGDGAGHKRIIADADDGSGVQLANGLWANGVYSGGSVNVKNIGFSNGDDMSKLLKWNKIYDTFIFDADIKIATCNTFANFRDYTNKQIKAYRLNVSNLENLVGVSLFGVFGKGSSYKQRNQQTVTKGNQTISKTLFFKESDNVVKIVQKCEGGVQLWQLNKNAYNAETNSNTGIASEYYYIQNTLVCEDAIALRNKPSSSTEGLIAGDYKGNSRAMLDELFSYNGSRLYDVKILNETGVDFPQSYIIRQNQSFTYNIKVGSELTVFFKNKWFESSKCDKLDFLINGHKVKEIDMGQFGNEVISLKLDTLSKKKREIALTIRNSSSINANVDFLCVQAEKFDDMCSFDDFDFISMQHLGNKQVENLVANIGPVFKYKNKFLLSNHGGARAESVKIIGYSVKNKGLSSMNLEELSVKSIAICYGGLDLKENLFLIDNTTRENFAKINLSYSFKKEGKLSCSFTLKSLVDSDSLSFQALYPSMCTLNLGTSGDVLAEEYSINDLLTSGTGNKTAKADMFKNYTTSSENATVSICCDYNYDFEKITYISYGIGSVTHYNNFNFYKPVTFLKHNFDIDVRCRFLL